MDRNITWWARLLQFLRGTDDRDEILRLQARVVGETRNHQRMNRLRFLERKAINLLAGKWRRDLVQAFQDSQPKVLTTIKPGGIRPRRVVP